MTIRVDSTSLIAGKTVVSLYAGHGVPANQIPNGGYLFNDIAAQGAAPTDEMRGEILAWPSSGILTVNEDSSFSFTGAPDGVYSFTYRGYRNGAAYGEYAVNLTIGAGQVDAAVAYTVPSRIFAAQINPVAPVVAAAVNYSLASPVFSVQALPVAPAAISASVSFAIPAPVFGVFAAASAPDVFDAAISYSLQPPMFAASVSATAALPVSATVSYQVKSPAFSVTASIAGTVVYIPDGALIVEKSGSNWMKI